MLYIIAKHGVCNFIIVNRGLEDAIRMTLDTCDICMILATMKSLSVLYSEYEKKVSKKKRLKNKWSDGIF